MDAQCISNTTRVCLKAWEKHFFLLKLLQLGLADRARGVGWMPEFKDLLSSLKVCPSVSLSALPRAYNVCYGCWVYEESGCTTLATTKAV